MKLLILGLEGADANLLFQDERLDGIHYLIEMGCYGLLKTELVENAAQVWINLSTSQIPTKDTSLSNQPGNSVTDKEPPIWEILAGRGRSVIVVDIPPGLSYPDWIQDKIQDIEKQSSQDQGTASDVKQVTNSVESLSRKKFDLLRELIQTEEWHYLQYVDSGIHQLWDLMDSGQIIEKEAALLNYYLYLDGQLKTTLELLDNETVVLLISPSSVTGTDGFFILAGGNNPLEGEIEGVSLLDISPTLLELGGYDIPAAMHGKSLVSGMFSEGPPSNELNAEEDEVLRERLSGLGYLE